MTLENSKRLYDYYVAKGMNAEAEEIAIKRPEVAKSKPKEVEEKPKKKKAKK